MREGKEDDTQRKQYNLNSGDHNKKKEGKKPQHTGVIWVSIDYLQEGNFGKSRFTEASFGWWAAVRQHIVLSMCCQSLQKQNNHWQQIHHVLHFFVEHWTRAVFWVGPAVFVLDEAIGQSWKQMKSQRSCCKQKRDQEQNWEKKGISRHTYLQSESKQRNSTVVRGQHTLISDKSGSRGAIWHICFVDHVDWGSRKQVPMLACFLRKRAQGIWLWHKIKAAICNSFSLRRSKKSLKL